MKIWLNLQAGIETANDYTKKSFVFRLHVTDGSEFLFAADTQVILPIPTPTSSGYSLPVKLAKFVVHLKVKSGFYFI